MKKNFLASFDKLYDMLQFVRESAIKEGFDIDCVAKIELAVEEALVNIINYAYSGAENGNIQIDCQSSESSGLSVIIQDKGFPFNPLENRKKFDNKKVSLEELAEGGFGVFFIIKIMDEVHYKREDEKNVLTLVKYKEP